MTPTAAADMPVRKTWRWLLVALLAFVPGEANAMTHQQMNAVADAWIAKVAPELPNHCVGEAMNYNYGDTGDSDGAAHGWRTVWVGEGWKRQEDKWVWTSESMTYWDHTKCEATIRSGLTLLRECAVRTHEKLHIVMGPAHVGPLAPSAGTPPACQPKLSKRADVTKTIHESFLDRSARAWRVDCNLRVTRCVARAPGARFARYYTVTSRDLISEDEWQRRER